jgi:hypothetical protein
MPDFKLSKLNKMYEDGKRCDEKIFSEQRTNILLKNGQHYSKKTRSFIDNLRTRGVINERQKIRLTKNHIHRITNEYENQILEGDSSPTATPFNETELSDIKQAEMGNAVIEWVKKTNSWASKKPKLVNDFSVIGEVFAKIRFDDSIGKVVGEDEQGNPVRLGQFVIDRVFGFDVKRDPAARDWDESRWLIQEQMVDLDEFKELATQKGSEVPKDKIANLKEDTNSVTKIFDPVSGKYSETRNQILVKELFWKPDGKYPNGYYVMFTKEFVVFKEELPFGIWPWEVEGFDELTTSPRSAGIIRVCRPYQVEMNRSASKMAEHQITLGDDKVYIQKGTKISSGGYLHGVRAIQVAGQQPVIQQGRSGAQYLEYYNSQAKEMYEAANVAHILEDKAPQGDAYQQLFHAMKHKKKFVKYVNKFEQFEIRVFKKVLDMSRYYLTPAHVIKVAGQTELMNIEEYKRIDQEGFELKMKAQSGDVEEKFGKVLGITSILQYAGSSLQPDQLGNLIRQMPFGNDEQMFSTLTVNYDNAVNDILAMDRGRDPGPPSINDDHKFMIQALDHRMRKSDFQFLPPQIQELYTMKKATHEVLFEQQQLAAQRAQMGLIPTDGFLVTINASWFNPSTNRVERIKVPSKSVEWLVKKVQEQGFFAQELQQLPLASQAAIGDNLATDNLQLIPGLGQQAQPENINQAASLTGASNE